MKTRYFGYYFKEHNSRKKYFFDMRALLKNFTVVDSPEYKNSFKHEDESLYLFPAADNVFLFVETRNTDFFRKIKKDSTLEDLRSVIDGDSRLGYSSYVVIGENYFGMASTYMAPGITPFMSFINDIIGSLGLSNMEFCVRPLLRKNEAKDVLSLNVIGRTSIEISRENTFAQQIANVFAQDISNDLSLGSIEVIFKPVQKGNIKPIVSDILSKMNSSPEISVKMRAKEFVKDTLTDFYLDENNAVSDEFSYKLESEIPGLISKKMADNKFLQPCLVEFVKNVKAEAGSSISLSGFNSVAAWSSKLGRTGS
ncbi:MAG: hypothetical protein PBV00_26030 [Pseudomonas asiatica]